MTKKRAKAKPAGKTKRAPAVRPKTTKRAEEAAFLGSLIAHGQAVPATASGKLPPGATHELTIDADRKLKAVRKRFSAF